MKESVQVDILTEVPRVGDTYMLCSDGLTGMIKDDTIQHIIMSERDLDRAVDRLIAAANEEGGVDNISVVLARIEAS
jgi:protein phosphatase